jgi:hypothetical protein
MALQTLKSSELAKALTAIEGIGWVLADAVGSGHGLDAPSCDAVVVDLRAVYRMVRALRLAASPAAVVPPRHRRMVRRAA